MLIAGPGAWLAWKRWFKPADIGIALDSIFLLGPGGQDDIDIRDMCFAAQLHFFNAGAEPEGMAEIRAFDAILTDDSQTCGFTAYASLKPLRMVSRAPGKPAEFRLEFKGLAQPAVLKREDQSVLHFLFFADGSQRFHLRADILRMEFSIKLKLASGREKRLPLIRYRKVDASEVSTFEHDHKIVWLSWHLDEQPPGFGNARPVGNWSKHDHGA